MAPCVRFLQCAGCRFDSPSWDGPEGWARQRNQDLWHSFEGVISLCRMEKVELLFLTGDLFEQEYVRKETVERVASMLAGLEGTKIFISPGERDPLVVTSAYRLAVWPSNVHIFPGGISSVKIPSQNVTIYGAGWTTYHQESSFLDGFELTQDETIPIMLLHAEVKSVKNSEGFIPILPEHLASSGLAYLALGHQDGWSGIQKAGETVWADSGVLETRSFSGSGPHGVILGKIEQGSIQIEFRELGQRHYFEKNFTKTSDIEALTTKILSETSPEERQKDMFRVKLCGPFQNAEALVHPVQAILADKFRFVEVICSDETNSQYGAELGTSLETLNGRGYPTLPLLFVDNLKARQINAESTETSHWELVKKIGLAALGQGRIDNEN